MNDETDLDGYVRIKDILDDLAQAGSYYIARDTIEYILRRNRAPDTIEKTALICRCPRCKRLPSVKYEKKPDTIEPGAIKYSFTVECGTEQCLPAVQAYGIVVPELLDYPDARQRCQNNIEEDAIYFWNKQCQQEEEKYV